MRRREWGILLLSTAVLTLLWTAPWWPVVDQGLLDAKARGEIQQDSDAHLVLWTLAWQAHALTSQPASFLDGNIFYPATNTLLGSDLFVSPALLAAPVYWSTNNPVLAANLLAIAGYGLCFLLTYLVIRRAGGSALGAALAGIAVALGPFRVPPDLHALQYPAWILPLTLLVWRRAEDRVDLVGWVALAAATALGLFTSFYMAVMVLMLLACEGILCWTQRGSRPTLRLLLATLPGGLALVAYSIPYLGREDDPTVTPLNLEASFETVGTFMQRAYLDPSHPMVGVGWIIAALALLGIISPALRRERPQRLWWRWLLLLVAGLLLAVGPRLMLGELWVTMPFAFLLETPLRALRAFPRFFILAQLGLAGFAALGADLLWRGLQQRKNSLWPSIVAALLLLGVALPRTLINLEAPYRRLPIGPNAPLVYRHLAAGEPGPLLEIPGPWLSLNLERKYVQSLFMVQSTHHWRPLLNGHTGYPPWWWEWLSREIYLIPDSRHALQAIADATGLRWIIVHREHLTAREWKRWQRAIDQQPDLSGAQDFGDHLLIPITLAPTRDWQRRLSEGDVPPGKTLLGTPREALSDTADRGVVSLLAGPARVPAASTFNLQLTVENTGSATWPALAPPRSALDDLVVLEARWDADGEPQVRRLMRDVFPGEVQEQWLQFDAPAQPGSHTLTLRLGQVGRTRFTESVPLTVPILVGEAGSNPVGSHDPVATGSSRPLPREATPRRDT